MRERYSNTYLVVVVKNLNVAVKQPEEPEFLPDVTFSNLTFSDNSDLRAYVAAVKTRARLGSLGKSRVTKIHDFTLRN